jgi:sulfite exporter TauE/SafE
LLPCGLVYVACAAAAATGGIVSGLEYMLVFGLGTVPMMFGLGLAGRFLHARLQGRIQRVIPVALGVMALLLILRGMSLGIPFLSPDLSGATGGGSCCH